MQFPLYALQKEGAACLPVWLPLLLRRKNFLVCGLVSFAAPPVSLGGPQSRCRAAAKVSINCQLNF